MGQIRWKTSNSSHVDELKWSGGENKAAEKERFCFLLREWGDV